MIRSRHRKGYTLIEILVATTIFVIAMSIAAGITVTSTKSVARALTTKKINSAVRDLNTRLTQELRNSSEVKVDSESTNIVIIPGTVDKTLKITSDKKLLLNEELLLPSDIEVEPFDVAFKTPNPKLVSISLKVSAKNAPTQSMEYMTSIACRK